MKRRVPGLIIVLFGVVIISVALFGKFFSVAPAFESMTDDFRPEMRASLHADLRDDLATLSATQEEFTTKVSPQLAEALKMTPAQFSATLQQQFPAVAGGMAAVPQITTEFGKVLTVLEDERSRFGKADAIPTKSLPATTVPFVLVGAGLLAFGTALLLPRRRGGVVAVVVGAMLIAGPIILSLPGKADAADTMNSNLKPVYTAELVSNAQQSLAAMQAMGAELQEKMLPALAQMMQMTPAEVQAYLGQFPAVGAGIAAMPESLARFDTLVAAFDSSLGNYQDIKSTELVPIVWLLIAGGALIALAGGLTLAQQAASAQKVRAPLGGRKVPA